MGFVYGCIAISLICGAFVLLVLLCRRMLRKAPSYWRVTAWLFNNAEACRARSNNIFHKRSITHI